MLYLKGACRDGRANSMTQFKHNFCIIQKIALSENNADPSVPWV